MTLDTKQLRELTEDVLHYLDPDIPYSNTAVELILLTIAQESKFGTYIRQIKGPARGIIQMEPVTENDIYEGFLPKKPSLLAKVEALRSPHIREVLGRANMEVNLAYQIAMCRVFYFRVPARLPDNSPAEMAAYWKKYYNTIYGAGTVEEAEANYSKYVLKKGA